MMDITLIDSENWWGCAGGAVMFTKNTETCRDDTVVIKNQSLLDDQTQRISLHYINHILYQHSSTSLTQGQ